MPKTALLFVDDEMIKVVIGTTLKYAKFSELTLDHNVRFFDRIFSDPNINVFIVDKASQLVRETFDAFVAKVSAADKAEELDEVEEVEERPRSAPRAAPAARPAQKKQAQTQQQANGMRLYRSTSETHIIVEDLPVGEGVRGESVQRYLAIAPNKAINLSVLDPEAVNRSVILRQLINDGTLVPCTPREASDLETNSDAQMRADSQARLEQFSPIIEDFSSGSARKYAEAVRSGRVTMPDLPEGDGGAYDVTDDGPRRPSSGGEMTMDDMLKYVGADDGGPSIREEAIPSRPKRQLEARPQRAGAGEPARAFRRAHKSEGDE